MWAALEASLNKDHICIAHRGLTRILALANATSLIKFFVPGISG
jgi:hypothetical protein